MPDRVDLEEYIKNKNLYLDLNETEIYDIGKRAEGLITDINIRREGTATFLAYTVSIVFCIIITLPLLFIFFFRDLDPGISEFIKSVLPSITTLLGVAFGFYFSEKRL